VTIVETFGYAAGSDVPVFSKSYSTVGTGAFTSWIAAPGDCAAIVRYSTTARTPKNHPVYLFNYYHGVSAVSTGGDTLHAAQKAAISAYAGSWISGFSDGAETLVRAGPNGATAVGQIVDASVMHRDFPR
jgi:hypothetical protein